MSDCATPPTTEPASPPNVIRSATPSIRRCAPAVTDTRAPCARWPTACSTSPARCCATAPVSTAPCRDCHHVSQDPRPVLLTSGWLLAAAGGREGERGCVRELSAVLCDNGVSMLSRARIEGRARPPRGVNPYIRAPAPTCTYDGRTSRPIPTSPPVSVRTDRGMTVPARDSDGRARRTRRPANPCTCRARSMTLILCGGLRKSGQSWTSRS